MNSLDEDLTAIDVAAKLPGRPLSAREFVQGRYIVRVSRSRHRNERSLPYKLLKQQDVANKVGTDSVPLLTPAQLINGKS